MRKKCLASLLALAMLLSLLPTAVFAAEPKKNEVTVSETVDTSDANLADNDELLAQYVQQLMYPKYKSIASISTFANWGSTSNVLNDSEKTIYSKLKTEIENVAKNGGSTVFFSNQGLALTWETNSTSTDALKSEIGAEIGKIIDCLLVDCPYDLYWYDKTESGGIGYSFLAPTADGTTATCTVRNFQFAVASAYQANGNPYQVNATKVQSAQQATEKANQIVQDNAGKSDYEKLLAYKEAICGLVEYNYEAADDKNTPYGDPWQIIYVFDGDTSTKVVCEGYAKAFQYLCDLSEFDNAVCYTVTGQMAGGTGAGGHMWNIVRTGGESYLVDVTNCDGNSVGNPDKLFMKAPTSGSAAEGYHFVFDSLNQISYSYDSDVVDLYGDTILTLSDADYTPPATLQSLTAEASPATVEVPTKSDIANVTLTAKATYDDGESPQEVGANWTLKEDYPGVELSEELLTIHSDAQAGSVIVEAEFRGETAQVTITLTKETAQATSIEILGPDKIAIPTSGSTTSQYTATVYDQYGAIMQDSTVTWSVSGSAAVSVDENGTVTVNSGAEADTVALIATCDNVNQDFKIILSNKLNAGLTITGVPEKVVMGEGKGRFYLYANATISMKDFCSWFTSNSQVLDIQNMGGSLSSEAYIAVKGPGTATITVTYEDDTHYGSASVEITVLKNPTLDDFNVTLPSNAVYDGSAKEAAVAVKDGITGMNYAVLYNGDKTVPTDAGTYTVTIQVEEGGYYTAATLNAGSFTIAKATPAIAVNNDNLTVTKNTSQSLGAKIDNGGALTYRSSNPSVATVDGNGKVTGVAEGTATITVSYAGDKNHDAVSKEVAVEVIGKTLVNVTFNHAEDQTYDPNGYALGDQFTEAAAVASATGENISYIYNGTTYSSLSDLPKVYNAGTYTVTAVYDSDTEHGEASATFTITKADQETLNITSTGPATYGVDYTLTTTGGTGTGAVTFEATGISSDAGRATVSGSTLHPSRAGIVEVIATKAGDNNYNPITSEPVHITIDKAEYIGTKDAAGSARYGTTGTVDLSSLIVSGGTATVGTVTDSDKILTDTPTVSGTVLTFAFKNSQDDVGKTAEILVTITSTNYKDYTISVRVTMVDKYVPVLDVKDLFGTYNGQPVPASVITGTAMYNGTAVEGTWSWTSEAPTNAGTHSVSVTFTPKDTETYISVTSTIMIFINKATPTGAPKYTAINTSGKTLADAGLTVEGGTFSVPGTVAWKDPLTTEVKVNTSYQWTFTPDDTDNYTTLTDSIELWHRSSSGGSSGSGNKTETETNPDGSVTTTVTGSNGTVTETTKYPDGSREVVETQKDGTVTTTTTDKTGNKTEVVENTDGSSKTTIDNKDGSSSVTTVDENGKVEAKVELPESVVSDAADKGEAVTLPMPSVSASSDKDEAPTVTVELPRNTSAKVEIPVRRVTSGTVAVLVKADGTEQVIKTSLTTDNGVTVTLSDGDTVKIVDNAKSFADVSSRYWGSDYIDFVTSREIFSGTGSNTFSPDMAMNRAMIVTVLAAYDGADTSSTGGAWYEAGQRWAMENGISDGTNMEQNLTREQLAVMLWSYAGRPTDGSSLAGYPDMGSVSSWATQAMSWAVKNGLISGMDGTLAPQGTATRAQVATILMRFVEKTV